MPEPPTSRLFDFSGIRLILSIMNDLLKKEMRYLRVCDYVQVRLDEEPTWLVVTGFVGNNEIVGIITETDLSHTIDAFSEAVEELTRFYADSRENMERMMDKWGDILVSLKGYKKISEYKELDAIKEDI